METYLLPKLEYEFACKLECELDSRHGEFLSKDSQHWDDKAHSEIITEFATRNGVNGGRLRHICQYIYETAIASKLVSSISPIFIEDITNSIVGQRIGIFQVDGFPLIHYYQDGWNEAQDGYYYLGHCIRCGHKFGIYAKDLVDAKCPQEWHSGKSSGGCGRKLLKGYKIERDGLNLNARFAILQRDGFTCQCCGRKAPEVKLEIDHKIPVSKGGTDDLSNLWVLCFDCNRGKSDKPLEGEGNGLFSNS